MNRILCICFVTVLLAATAQAQTKKSVLAKANSATTKKKHISEHEAKLIHLQNLASQGKTKFRSAYKRTDTEMISRGTDMAGKSNISTNYEKSQFTENRINNTDKKKSPKFIDGIVINRN